MISSILFCYKCRVLKLLPTSTYTKQTFGNLPKKGCIHEGLFRFYHAVPNIQNSFNYALWFTALLRKIVRKKGTSLSLFCIILSQFNHKSNIKLTALLNSGFNLQQRLQFNEVLEELRETLRITGNSLRSGNLEKQELSTRIPTILLLYLFIYIYFEFCFFSYYLILS